MSEAITQAAAYDLIDRFLRNNLYDDDYAKYSDALEALSQPAPSPQPADSDDQDAKWRDVALRFDKHRMSALWHLQALLKDPARHAEVVRKFLSDPTHPNVQPAAPVVSAEQIEDLAWLDVDEDGEIDRSSDHNKMMTAPQRCAFKRGARAILAMRPAVEPMTLEQREVLAALVVGACEHKTRTFLALRAIEATEAQYGIGITAKAEDTHQPTKEAEKP